MVTLNPVFFYIFFLFFLRLINVSTKPLGSSFSRIEENPRPKSTQTHKYSFHLSSIYTFLALPRFNLCSLSHSTLFPRPYTLLFISIPALSVQPSNFGPLKNTMFDESLTLSFESIKNRNRV